MSIEENKRIIITFFDSLNEGNIQKAFSHVSEDVEWWIAGALPFSGTKNRQEYMQLMEMIQSQFPNGFRIKAKEMTAENDRVAVEAESYGEHLNNKIYQNKYHFLIIFRDGKFIQVKEYMDTLHLYQLIQN